MSKNYLLNKLINVLILNNEEKVLKITKNYLLSNNINIIVTKTFPNANIQLKKNNIDCLIIDTSLVSDQYSVIIQKLKKDPKLQHIPFIILTPRGFAKDRLDGYKSGCTAYLSKPFDLMELQYIIKSLVHKKNLLTQELISNYFVLKKIRSDIVRRYKHSFEKNLNLQLTPKEELILSYILKDKNVKDMTEKLKIHTRTIEKSISRILDKTYTKNNKELKTLPWNIL